MVDPIEAPHEASAGAEAHDTGGIRQYCGRRHEGYDGEGVLRERTRIDRHFTPRCLVEKHPDLAESRRNFGLCKLELNIQFFPYLLFVCGFTIVIFV